MCPQLPSNIVTMPLLWPKHDSTTTSICLFDFGDALPRGSPSHQHDAI